MATEMVSKASLFAVANQNRFNDRISVFPKGCVSSCSMSSGFPSLKVKSQPFRLSSSLNSDFHGNRVVFQERKGMPWNRNSSKSSIVSQSGLIGKAHKWWEKGLQPNMKEVNSAQDLVDSLVNAGDKLVIVDFFSPGCGGCKALHPKICQFAEMNPDVQFLQVNYEEHKSMCYSLNVHVLPFFRFYRGAHGRLCSFSCTNATIKKFKDALAKYTPPQCSLGPTKGLEEKELLALAANKDLSFTYTPEPEQNPVIVQTEATPLRSIDHPFLSLHLTPLKKSAQDKKTMVTSGK